MPTGRARKGAPVADTPVFDALLTEAQQPKAAELVSVEELDRRRPLTAKDHALADEYLAILDRLEEEQDAEVSDIQARLLNVVLVAAHYLRGEPAKTLAA